MIGDTHFQRYLPEPHEDLVAPEEIRRHILCTGTPIAYDYVFTYLQRLFRSLGQVYYTLLQERQEKGIKDVAISRVEQISPFPYDMVRSLWRILPFHVYSSVSSLLRTSTSILMPIFYGAK